MLESPEAWSADFAMGSFARISFVSRGLLLSYMPIVWNGCVGAGALLAAVLAGSPATAAFALNALLDSSASVVLVWRFRRALRDPHAADQHELRSQQFIVAAMSGVAMFVAYDALDALAAGSHAHGSLLATVLAAASLLALPWLGRAKLQVAGALASPALRGDGVLTIAAAVFAAITLLALLLNSSFGAWWADPIAALEIAFALAVEAMRIAIRHVFG